MDRLEEIKVKLNGLSNSNNEGFTVGEKPLNDECSDSWLYSFGRHKTLQAAVETVNKFSTLSELDEWLPFVQTIHTLKSTALEQIPTDLSVAKAFDVKILEGSVDCLKELIGILTPIVEGVSNNGE
jgi:hypothetical protein